MLQLVKSGDIEFCIISSANTATMSPQAGVMSLHFLFRSEDHLIKALADPEGVRGGQGHDRRHRAGRSRHRARARRACGTCTARRRSTRSRTSRAYKVRVQATADRGHHVPGLWRADRAYAVRQRLHLAADRRGRRRRKRRQRLSRQQALRSGAGAVDDRARGQQQPGLDQRQAVEEPDAEQKGMGADRGRRGQHARSRPRRSSSSTSRRPS